jgi:hypothetical protein
VIPVAVGGFEKNEVGVVQRCGVPDQRHPGRPEIADKTIRFRFPALSVVERTRDIVALLRFFEQRGRGVFGLVLPVCPLNRD